MGLQNEYDNLLRPGQGTLHLHQLLKNMLSQIKESKLLEIPSFIDQKTLRFWF